MRYAFQGPRRLPAFLSGGLPGLLGIYHGMSGHTPDESTAGDLVTAIAQGSAVARLPSQDSNRVV